MIVNKVCDVGNTCITLCTLINIAVAHEEEKDDILNLLKSQITDTATSRDKVLLY